MRRTLIEAVDLSIAVWKALAESGNTKNQLPKELKAQIKSLYCRCPLCALFMYKTCDECPLKSCGTHPMSDFAAWDETSDRLERKKYAQNIVNTLEAWKKENDNAQKEKEI